MRWPLVAAVKQYDGLNHGDDFSGGISPPSKLAH
jgi:hypothetical protein